MPLATAVTPNLLEAKLLSSMEKITSIQEMEEAARHIKEYGVENIVIKGGTSFHPEKRLTYFMMEKTLLFWKKK